MNEYYIRRLPFPNKSVKAATFPNDDGTFDVYLNTLYPEAVQEDALRHELAHIRLGHFYSDRPVREMEDEADGLPPRREEDGRAIPLFTTADELAQWLVSLM